ncbi:MAG TPA: hypothetical protein VFR37_08465, partial [Longimicrobium sp.]|nr:hypothetical protein [Longimicrobium sp.]
FNVLIRELQALCLDVELMKTKRKVLVKELQSLGLSVEVLNEDEERVDFGPEEGIDVPELGISVTLGS